MVDFPSVPSCPAIRRPVSSDVPSCTCKLPRAFIVIEEESLVQGAGATLSWGRPRRSMEEPEMSDGNELAEANSWMEDVRDTIHAARHRPS
eukprot:scaffold126_cov315-Pavlova_lutheri.AAC.16